MESSMDRKNRILAIFFRMAQGEGVSVKKMATEYGVSTKSITRYINQIKDFLSENRELVGNVELVYSFQKKTYSLEFHNFLLSKELIAMIKILIGSRALDKLELLKIITKLKQFTSSNDKKLLEMLINKELYHYQGVEHDCNSVIDIIWQLTQCIQQKKEITVTYFKMNRKEVMRRLKPIAVIFSEYYYYLIAYNSEQEDYEPRYFRVDRITQIIQHRGTYEIPSKYTFDEGELRKKIQFMFPGKEQKIRFEFTGPSTQAILDRMPTAKIIAVEGNKTIIEAITYGEGIKMYLLSQGSWVKVISPPELVEEMKQEIEKMKEGYE